MADFFRKRYLDILHNYHWYEVNGWNKISGEIYIFKQKLDETSFEFLYTRENII